jgi:DNA repair exonuclease SbcCD ATPase subunit
MLASLVSGAYSVLDSYAKAVRKEITMAASVLEQIRNVEHQKAKVKAETLRKVKQALKELNKLGFDYRVVRNGEANGKAVGTGGDRVNRTARTPKGAPCKICGFRTVSPHDARAHRGQTKKAPFTRRELAERGLRRV